MKENNLEVIKTFQTGPNPPKILKKMSENQFDVLNGLKQFKIYGYVWVTVRIGIDS